MTTTVLVQILNAQGVVIQVQEQDVPDAQATYSTPNVVAIQTADMPTDNISNEPGPT